MTLSQNDSFSLDNLTIASPSTVDWHEMQGDNQVRFCGQCQLNVYNLSGMTRQDAETLVSSQEGRLCIRMYKRHDGTVITQDCPVGLSIRYKRHAKNKVLKLGKIAAIITLVTVAGIYTANVSPAMAGGMEPLPSKMGEIEVKGRPAVNPAIMGDVAVPIQGNVAQPVSPPPLMGKPAMPPKKPLKKAAKPPKCKDKDKPKPPVHTMGIMKPPEH